MRISFEFLAFQIAASSNTCRRYTSEEHLRLAHKAKSQKVTLASTRRLLQEHFDDSYLEGRHIEHI